MGKNRLIVVSNRLPVTQVTVDGVLTFELASGGLVSALSGVQHDLEFVWVGWLGSYVAEKDQVCSCEI